MGCGGLERQPDLPTRALIADVGNDLGFGASVEQAAAALAACLGRLQAAGSRTIIVLPPVTGIERLSPRRFRLLRSLLFPGRAIDQGSILSGLRRLTTELRGLVADADAQLVEPDPRWLGFDGIHLRRRRREVAWRSLLAGWTTANAPARSAARLRWSWRRAERADFLTMQLRNPQPCRRFADGSTLACY